MTTREKLIDKLRKLRALSESSNVNEAALAASMAAELIAEHQVAEAELDVTYDDQIDEHEVDRYKAMPTWRWTLGDAAATISGCDCFRRSERTGVASRRIVSRLMIVGRPSDVEAAKYLYRMFCRETDRLAEDGWHRRTYAARHITARKWKSNFRLGCSFEIHRRATMMRSKCKERKGCTALVVRDDAVKAFMDNLKLSEIRPGRMTNVDGFTAGIDAGKSVQLSGGQGLPEPAKRIKS